MNLAESMKFVLKNKGQNIFTEFWKEDIVTILKEMRQELFNFSKSGPKAFRGLKNISAQGFKLSFNDFRDTAIETFTHLKVMPGRVREGLHFFHQEFVHELEALPDQKHKTLFCLKVFGALSSLTLSAVYGYKKSHTDTTLTGLRNRSAFAQILLAELVVKIINAFARRFLQEVEKEITSEEDLRNVQYFKSILSHGKNGTYVDELVPTMKGDKAYEIVDNLKNYIFEAHKPEV